MNIKRHFNPLDWLLEHFGSEIRAMHEIQCRPDEFNALISREKRHIVRPWDQDYAVDDWMILREWDPQTKAYTGRQLLKEITHITQPGTFGLPEKICVMSIM